jgi:Family of unknown function (DUF6272)
MQSNAIVMAYKGAASGKLLDSLINVAQAKLSEIEQKRTVKKKVFAVLVEILQNIYHHFNNSVNLEQLSEDDSILFVFAKIDDIYAIMTGNLIAISEIPALKSKIDVVNSMSHDEIKDRYREVLSTGELSEKGGAGLGIIDIARKSGSKLEYEFLNYNENYAFFNLIVKISAI